MRIISNFHDFYDRVVGEGFDDSTLFLRKEEIVEFGVNEMFERRRHGKTSVDDDAFSSFIFYYDGDYDRRQIHYACIIFCGRRWIIPYDYRQDGSHSVYQLNGHYTRRLYPAFTFEEFEKRYYELVFKKDMLKIREIMSHNGEYNQKWVDIGIQFKSPIVVWDRGENRFNRRVNSNLKEFGFYHIMDHYQTYQEIEMFLNGPLVDTQGPPMATVSDEVRKSKHGFDEWSFRKMKGQ